MKASKSNRFNTEKIVSAPSQYREEMHPAIQQGVKILVLHIEQEI
jgi:hypothetical protein